jgi:hypothetical protein
MESVLASHFDDLQDCNGRAALAILFDRFGHFLTNAKRLENADKNKNKNNNNNHHQACQSQAS